MHNVFLLEFPPSALISSMFFFEKRHSGSLATVLYFSQQRHKVFISNGQGYVLGSLAVHRCVGKVWHMLCF